MSHSGSRHAGGHGVRANEPGEPRPEGSIQIGKARSVITTNAERRQHAPASLPFFQSTTTTKETLQMPLSPFASPNAFKSSFARQLPPQYDHNDPNDNDNDHEEDASEESDSPDEFEFEFGADDESSASESES